MQVKNKISAINYRKTLVLEDERQIMKYTTEYALKEINRRARTILKKREKKITNLLATIAGVTLVVLFAVIGEFSVPKLKN